MKAKNSFKYSYCAPTAEERKEIESIKLKYQEKTENEGKLERLRKLDKKVKNLPTVWALCVGIVGILIFGTGLSLVLEWNSLIWGIIVMIIGAVPVAIAYPIFIKLTLKLKKKYGEEILSLSAELLNEKETKTASPAEEDNGFDAT